MSKFWLTIDRLLVVVGALSSAMAAVYARLAYLDTHPASQRPTAAAESSLIIDPLWIAVGFGVLAAALLTVGIIGLRFHRPRASTEAPLNAIVGKAFDPPHADSDMRHRASRSATEMQFLRRRRWFALFAGAPFYSYQAKRRLEFIDSWATYFKRKTKNSQITSAKTLTERQAVIAMALDYVVGEAPNELYQLCRTVEQLEDNLCARLLQITFNEAASTAQASTEKAVKENGPDLQRGGH